MTAPDSVLVVGGPAAGSSTVESLRRAGCEGRITVLGAEKHAPYDRPPLSKQALSGAGELNRPRLRADEGLPNRRHEVVDALAEGAAS